MKFAIAALAFLAAASVLAEESPQLMIVSGHSGYVPEGMQYHIECKIYGDYTFLETTKGRDQAEFNVVDTKYTSKVKSAKAALAMINKMAKGKMRKSMGPQDGPTTSYVGILEGDVIDQHVKIFTNGSSISRNSAETSVAAMVEFADLNCGTK
jgi:hypothetical protein